MHLKSAKFFVVFLKDAPPIAAEGEFGRASSVKAQFLPTCPRDDGKRPPLPENLLFEFVMSPFEGLSDGTFHQNKSIRAPRPRKCCRLYFNHRARKTAFR